MSIVAFLFFISSLSYQLCLDLLYFTLTSVVSSNYKRAYIMTMTQRQAMAPSFNTATSIRFLNETCHFPLTLPQFIEGKSQFLLTLFPL